MVKKRVTRSTQDVLDLDTPPTTQPSPSTQDVMDLVTQQTTQQTTSIQGNQGKKRRSEGPSSSRYYTRRRVYESLTLGDSILESTQHSRVAEEEVQDHGQKEEDDGKSETEADDGNTHEEDDGISATEAHEDESEEEDDGKSADEGKIEEVEGDARDSAPTKIKRQGTGGTFLKK